LIQLSKKPVRSRKLENGSLIFEEVPLFSGYGTHIVYIHIGTPPQRVSVIVDTGSHYTAFPCKGCNSCGSHTDPYFDVEKSSTARTSTCTECRESFSCKATSKRCEFNQHYSEGSSWNAFQVVDKVFAGPPDLNDQFPVRNHSNFSLDFIFGCINSQTGLFNSQLADGIMGMSASEYTLTRQIYKAGLIERETFCLCFSKNGGYMSLGSVNAASHLKPMTYTKMLYNSGWFSIQLVDIEIAGESIGLPSSVYSKGKNAIVDSGTTDTYLPMASAAAFKAKWKELTKSDYSNSPLRLSEKKFSSLPVLTFVFEGGVRVDMPPENYLEKNPRSNLYTPRVYLDERTGSVFGANFMRNNDVLFDQTNQRIGFAPANCEWESLESDWTPEHDDSPDDDAPKIDVECEKEFRIVQDCDAICTGKGDDAKGHEIWAEVFEKKADHSKCEEPRTERRKCTVHCGDFHGDAGEKCDDVWGPCGANCKQTRQKLTAFGRRCRSEERACHIGPNCPEAHMGLMVTGRIEIELLNRKIWTPEMSDILTDGIAKLLYLPSGKAVSAGDVEVEYIEKKRRVESSKKAYFEVGVLVHAPPVVDEATAAALEIQMCAGDFSAGLQKRFAKGSESRFGSSDVESVRLGCVDVGVVTASGKAPYEFSDVPEQWKPLRFGGVGGFSKVFSRSFFLVLVVFAGISVCAVKRRGLLQRRWVSRRNRERRSSGVREDV